MMDKPDRKADSWFYHSYKGKKYDTTFYRYDAAQRVVEVKYGKSARASRMVYAYDAGGNCISQQYYRNGQPAELTQYVYDAQGHLLQVIDITGSARKVRLRMSYDGKGRILEKISHGYFADSTVYLYTDSSKAELVFHSYGFERMGYDRRDSLVSRSRYSWVSNGKMKTALLEDSVVIRRDTAGRMISCLRKNETWDKELRVISGQLDAAANCFTLGEVVYGDSSRTDKWFYDSLGRVIRYERYYRKTLMEKTVYVYNVHGDLESEWLYNGSGKLLQREVYRYVYY